MNHLIKSLFILLSIPAVVSCAVNPATGGANLVLMSESKEKEIGAEEHQKVLDSMPLFEDDEPFNNARKEWDSMPEFIQTELKPFCTIKMNFKTEKDMEDFEKFIGQHITDSCKQYWFPKLNIVTHTDEVYTDES